MFVLQILMQIADDFIDNVVTSACQIAKHRKANTLEVKDVQLHLGEFTKISITHSSRNWLTSLRPSLYNFVSCFSVPDTEYFHIHFSMNHGKQLKLLRRFCYSLLLAQNILGS